MLLRVLHVLHHPSLHAQKNFSPPRGLLPLFHLPWPANFSCHVIPCKQADPVKPSTQLTRVDCRGTTRDGRSEVAAQECRIRSPSQAILSDGRSFLNGPNAQGCPDLSPRGQLLAGPWRFHRGTPSPAFCPIFVEDPGRNANFLFAAGSPIIAASDDQIARRYRGTGIGVGVLFLAGELEWPSVPPTCSLARLLPGCPSRPGCSQRRPCHGHCV
jgi:hypothetical protein